MSSRLDRPVPLPRTIAKAGRPLSKLPVGSPLSQGSACQDNSLHKGDKQNRELHTSFMSRSDYKKLQEENARLKYDLKDMRSQFEQLIEEGRNECFDERRVNLLKAQLLQLERQVVLLTEGLSSRTALVWELNTSLEALSAKLSSFLSTEGSASEVTIPRSTCLQMIEICQTMGHKLQRNQESADLSKLALPWMLKKDLVQQPTTVLDICYGKIENLNLRYVSALEGKLNKLRRHLLAMRQNLSFMLAPGQMSSEAALRILPTAVYARLINHAAQCHQSVEECCNDLLNLTLLIPSAPWEILENSVSQEFTVENVLATLPAFPKGAPQQRAKRAVEALVKAQNYSRQMAMQQILALQAELSFHRNLYNLQVKYTEAVFDGIKQAYHAFQDNVAMVLCSPLQDVFSYYAKLRAEASEAALKDFLTAFRNNAEQIQYAVETLTPPKNQQHEGDEALSRCGKEFFLSLERSLKVCGEQRDKAASEMEILQIELDKALETLQNLKEQKEKKGEASRCFPKYEERKTEGALNILSRKMSEPEHRHALLVKHVDAAGSDIVSSSAKEKMEDSDGETIHPKVKFLQRSQSMKATERPPWQD